MKRRTFLNALAGVCVSNVLPMSLTPAFGATPDRFLITITAAGGWDPTAFVDPKGSALRADGRGPINNYSASDIRSAGNLIYAAYPSSVLPVASDSPGHMDNFFAKHYQRLLVINGVDAQTTSHVSGSRFMWSGRIEEGFPSVGALVAAPYAGQPMAYISTGGYDYTASLVSPVKTATPATFAALAYPNSQYADSVKNRKLSYFNDSAYSAVQAARDARLARLQSSESLPKRLEQMQQLELARSSDEQLQSLLANLPATVSASVKGQAEVAVAAFASGLAASANMYVDGFDTHAGNDTRQAQSLTILFECIDHLWTQIEKAGLQNKVTILIGSDFGRTPFYNTAGGKDHWNVTTVMAMGAGITGNRVIGATSANFDALKINPSTLETHSEGIFITPKHIHRALRDFIGVSPELDRQFPIVAEPLALFI
ncbi:MAG: DUF1501 domain-containing protein [Pseudomonadota bacterium]